MTPSGLTFTKMTPRIQESAIITMTVYIIYIYNFICIIYYTYYINIYIFLYII